MTVDQDTGDTTGRMLEAGLLWFRLGGKYMIVLCIAGLVLSNVDVPSWSAPVAYLGALGFAAYSYIKLQPFLALGRTGVRIKGRVSDVRDRLDASSKGSGAKRQLAYTYEVKGQCYSGETTWQAKRRFGTLDTGHEIPLLVDPTRPELCHWVEEVPASAPA